MPTAYAELLPADQPTRLYHAYPAESAPQPTHLVIDLYDGEVSCNYNPEIGNAVPAGVDHRVVLWLPIPILATEYANQLIREALPYVQRILDDAQIVSDGSNNVGQLGDAATAALEELERHIAENYPDAREMTVEEFPAAHWLGSYAGDPVAADALGINADTPDADLPALAGKVEREVLGFLSNAAGATAVTGTLEAVTALRAAQRDRTRDRLEYVAEQLEDLRIERDRLIRRIHGWNAKDDRGRDVDSLRDISVRAGISHTQVDRIIRNTAAEDVDQDFADYRVQQHLADGTWESLPGNGYDLAAEALEVRDRHTAVVLEHNRPWNWFRVVDRSGYVVIHPEGKSHPA